ncbi:hypothetical protein [Paracoccus salsus]|nr:hypothetical protein [Paracoccus salsus]
MPHFIWLPVFASVNQIQAAFTGLCPATMLFKALEVRPGPAF